MHPISHARTFDRPGRPAANPDRDTRTLLLNAATELFAERGVAATTLTNIARRAGLTPAMVHYHFADRDQLVDAVVKERILPLISYVWDPVQPGDEPAELVAGLVQRLLEQISKAPWIASTWMREVLIDGGLLRPRLVKHLPFDKLSTLVSAIASGQKFHTVNPELQPQLIVFSTLGLVMIHMATLGIWSEIFQRPPLKTDEIRRHITSLLLHGIQGAVSRRKPTTHKKAAVRRTR